MPAYSAAPASSSSPGVDDTVPPIVYGVETVLSIIGAGIAGTLWWAHRANVDLPCTSGGGCDAVNASRWSHVTLGPVHDMPVALAGFLTYIVLLSLAMAKVAADSSRARRLLHGPFWLISTFGVGYSWYLQYVAHFRVGKFCVWCFSSAVVMTLLWLVAAYESARHLRRPSALPSESRPAAHV